MPRVEDFEPLVREGLTLKEENRRKKNKYEFTTV
jgi:hypothetical protein